nr:hypothetical protein [uncultured Desulfobulbus sp.]
METAMTSKKSECDLEISAQYKRASFVPLTNPPRLASFFPLKDDENYLAALMSDPLLENQAKPTKREF